MRFDEAIKNRRMLIKNRVDIFGDQLLVDENDEVIGTEPDLLPNATQISIDEVPLLVGEYHGICYPAHIDREANGILATLGMFPETPRFTMAELHDADKLAEYREKHPVLKDMHIVVGSDAHYLWDIRDKEHYFELHDEPYSSDLVRQELFRTLKGGKR